ncbi:L,D-transpeptidase [Mesorhizobium sp. ANAO-SY3R2]|uniref:L,D-transpeptidase n=1 Tax=Mesorhizobium sp. ANAO-SY3R2 TaxID=3166644 RepID=UPI00366E85A7
MRFIAYSRSVPLAILVAVALSGCSTSSDPETAATIVTANAAPIAAFQPAERDPVTMYREMDDKGFRIAAVNAAGMKPELVRQVVDYPTTQVPGTVVVDQTTRFLYFVLPGGQAIRYAVAVGPVARAFPGGEAVIAHKASWPRWTPTPNMIKRNPAQYERHRGGIDGGPANPMGARALYMHQNGVDTYYRVHGTNDPSSIGRAVSAGCIRLLNQDIIDLHDRVRPGAKIVVL